MSDTEPTRTATTEREAEWYDDFWESIDPDEDDMTSAVRILGELLADAVIVRQGDDLRGTERCFLTPLSPEDQFLIRRIQRAVGHAESGRSTDV